MITKLNLSSHPFRNRTLPWIIAACLLGFSAVGLFWALNQWRIANHEAEVAKQNVGVMETQLSDLKSKGEKVTQSLTPDQQAMLVASHKLVAQKQFSWTRLLSDLEAVLPNGASVSQIKVINIAQRDGGTFADLDLGVLSRDPGNVINMVSTMNDSGNFQAELRSQDYQSNERGTYTEYTLRIRYAARSGVPSNQIAENLTETR